MAVRMHGMPQGARDGDVTMNMSKTFSPQFPKDTNISVQYAYILE